MTLPVINNSPNYVIQNLSIKEYTDEQGIKWKQVHGCEPDQCGPNREGAWCCKPGIITDPARHECVFLQNNRCTLHDSKLGRKPFICIITPLPGEVENYTNCTVRWEKCLQ